ncbi:MAG TPA: tRNA-binding protein [archaeon]|nr:tRNA-binding protein [archaeon]
MVSWQEFENVEMRVGTVIDVQDFPEAKKPAYKLTIDFGDCVKKSSVQITALYKKEEMIGRQVVCVTNFPPKQIANFMSECLTTGFLTEQGVVLLQPERKVPNGLRVM